MDLVASESGGDSGLAGTRPWAGVAYDGASESIGHARQFAADFLTRLDREQGVEVSSRVVGAAQLVVSELVTNACKYAPGPCAVDLQLVEQALEITVWDADPVLPVPSVAEPGRIGQHGLEIVVALCEGFEMQRERVGKRIRVRLLLGPAESKEERWSGRNGQRGRGDEVSTTGGTAGEDQGDEVRA